MSERIRVAQVVTRFMAGAGGVALRGALALDPDRYEVAILAGSGGRLLDEARDAGLDVAIVEHLRPEISPRDDRQALAELTRLLHRGQFDVVHTHSAKAGTLGRLAARWVEVPRIVHTFHGFPFHEFQSRPRRAGYVAIERALGRFTHAFLAVGTAVAAEAIRRGIAPPDRIRTIGVAVDTATPTPTARDRAEARRLLGIPPGTTVVGTVGRLDYQKAPEDFIEAIARTAANEVFGVWIGDGPLRAEAESLVSRRALVNRFAFLGERADVPALLPGLDIFAMSSRYEGLPCAVVEAMTAGLPVVATAVNAVPDVVVPGETGLLVPPERPDLLARAIGHLVEQPLAAARLGAAGRAALGDRLTPTALGRVLDQTYCGAEGHVEPASIRPYPALREAV